MKKTLTTIAATLIMITSFSSFATEKINPLRNMESNKVLITYLEATTMGSIDFNKYLFADDFEYRNVASNKTYNKNQYTNFLKSHKGIALDCKTTYEVLDQSGNICVAKATLTFETFTRVDYITLSHNEDGWKINKVETTYPANQ